MLCCTYNLLNIFRALIYPPSRARDYTSVIAAYGVKCLCCWWSAVRSRVAGYASGMREISAIKHPVASSWFSSLRLYEKCCDRRLFFQYQFRKHNATSEILFILYNIPPQSFIYFLVMKLVPYPRPALSDQRRH